jgi:hypothetical protein
MWIIEYNPISQLHSSIGAVDSLNRDVTKWALMTQYWFDDCLLFETDFSSHIAYLKEINYGDMKPAVIEECIQVTKRLADLGYELKYFRLRNVENGTILPGEIL